MTYLIRILVWLILTLLPELSVWAADNPCSLTRLPLGQDAQSLIYNPVNARYYTANRRDGTVTILNAQTGEMIQRPTVAEPIALIAQDNTGWVFIAGFTMWPPRLERLDPWVLSATNLDFPDDVHVNFSRSFSLAVDRAEYRLWYGNAIGPAGGLVVWDMLGRQPPHWLTAELGYTGMGSIPWSVQIDPIARRVYALLWSSGDGLRRVHVAAWSADPPYDILGIWRDFGGTDPHYSQSAIITVPNYGIWAVATTGQVAIFDEVGLRWTIEAPGGLQHMAEADGFLFVGSGQEGNPITQVDLTNGFTRRVTGVGGVMAMDFNPVAGWVFVRTYEELFAIDPVTATVGFRCPLLPAPRGLINNEGQLLAHDPLGGEAVLNLSSGNSSVDYFPSPGFSQR